MPKLLLTCDEVWPIFELVIPEKGQEPNCECPEEFYREYLHIATEYQKFQRELKHFYDEQERLYPDYIGGYRFPEGCIPVQYKPNKITLPSENRLSAIFSESDE